MRSLVHRPVPAAPKVWIKSGVSISIPTICRQSSPPEFAALQLRWFIDPSYALLSDPKGAQTSNASPCDLTVRDHHSPACSRA
jgi:hypothetical protein